MKVFRKILSSVAVFAAVGIGFALAQVYPVPLLPYFAPSTDLVQVVQGGVPNAAARYVYAGQLSGALLYQNLGVITTGNTYTFASGQGYILAQPAGTLAAVTLVTEANPSDGQKECFISTQTTTSLTWSANTGQSISGAPTAGVAQTAACMIYVKSVATWYRAQ